MRVVFLGPAYPPEMRQFTRGLAEVGAEVYGIGDTPRAALPADVKYHLHDYLEVPGILDEVFAIALAKKPEDRFQSAPEMLEALEEVDLEGGDSERAHRSSGRLLRSGARRRPPAAEPASLSTSYAPPVTISVVRVGRRAARFPSGVPSAKPPTPYSRVRFAVAPTWG